MGRYLELGRGETGENEESRPAVVWCTVVEEVAEKWNARFAGRREAPWVDEAWDDELQERIGAAIRRGELEECARGMARWKVEWEGVIERAGKGPGRNPRLFRGAVAENLLSEGGG